MKHVAKRMIELFLRRKGLALVNRKEFFQQKLLLGKQLSNQLRLLPLENFNDAEFSVFSQWGDDGLIQLLVQHMPDIPKTFVEFGVENYEEANTRFLLCNDNWTGLVMDGSAENVQHIQNDYEVSIMRGLQSKQAFITAENINDLLTGAGFLGELGILHIDIDGNDYWVWKAVEVVQPQVVIMEYNALFGPSRAITTPYQADFFRTNAHHSNLFFGASLTALYELGEELGYALLGSNLHANNAYFVRKDVLPESLKRFVTTPKVAHRWPTFKEERNIHGELTGRLPREAFENLYGKLEVWNTQTRNLEAL